MRTTVLNVIACLSSIILLNVCNPDRQDKKVDKVSEMAAVEKAIDGTIGWAKNKNFQLLYSIIANDSNYLEVQPKRVIKGFEEFKKAEEFWGSPDFKAIRYNIRNLKISLSKSGDVAWFYCGLDDINEWKGQDISWIDARWTGVLEKREGRWVMVQMHFSLPVA